MKPDGNNNGLSATGPRAEDGLPLHARSYRPQVQPAIIGRRQSTDVN